MTTGHHDPFNDHPTGLAMACALSALAGAVDACGLALLRDKFVSFMSGNTTLLAVALGHGEWAQVEVVGGLVAVFIAGAALGQMVALAAGPWRLPVVIAAVAAVLAVPLAVPVAAAPALVLGMGGLNAAMPRAGGIPIGITYVTGTLVRLGQGIGAALLGRTEPDWVRQAVPWLGLLAGAVAGTAMQHVLGAGTLWPLPAIAAALAAVATVVAGIGHPRRRCYKPPA